MRISQTIDMAVRGLKRNKLRAALSLLGIVIGVFSVTLIVTLGLGIQAYVTGQVETFGKNLIAIRPVVPGLAAKGIFAGTTDTTLTSLKNQDIETLQNPDLFPYLDAVSASRLGQEYLTAGGNQVQTLLFAVNADYPATDAQATMAEGRFFTSDEERSYAPVVTLGSSAAKTLFGQLDPVGRKVLVRGLSLQVVGVMAARGSFGGIDIDTSAFLPLGLAQKRLLGGDYVREIVVRVQNASDIPRAVDDITRILRRKHGITDPSKDDFLAVSSSDILDTIRSVTGAMAFLLGFLAMISLVVGGVGIMTVMLVSVTERIREVGLRKAIGATNRDIMLQFLAEAVALSVGGGLIGGGLGIVTSLLAIALANHAGYAVPYLVSLPAFLVAATVAAVIGVVFGIYPARKASALDPIVALRFE